jgi:hypothetical protein
VAVATEPQQLGSLRFVAAVLLGTPSWSLSLALESYLTFSCFRKICARCALCSPGVSCIKAFALCVCVSSIYLFFLSPKRAKEMGERRVFFICFPSDWTHFHESAIYQKYFVVLFYLLNVWNFDIPFCLLRSVPELEGIVNASSLCCI